MNASVVIYQLSRKFVNRQEDMPESARQVVYYALAVGHHVGVMDCFSTLAEIPLDEFTQWLDGLPEGEGRAKMAGVLKWGEIEINRGHVEMLLPLLRPAGAYTSWILVFAQSLQAMLREPALYLMLRKRL